MMAMEESVGVTWLSPIISHRPSKQKSPLIATICRHPYYCTSTNTSTLSYGVYFKPSQAQVRQERSGSETTVNESIMTPSHIPFCGLEEERWSTFYDGSFTCPRTKKYYRRRVGKSNRWKKKGHKINLLLISRRCRGQTSCFYDLINSNFGEKNTGIMQAILISLVIFIERLEGEHNSSFFPVNPHNENMHWYIPTPKHIHHPCSPEYLTTTPFSFSLTTLVCLVVLTHTPTCHDLSILAGGRTAI